MEISNFDHTTKDSRNQSKPVNFLGKTFRHQKNMHVYLVTGIAWNGETDEWMLLHMREGSSETFARSVTNFMDADNGVSRFISIETVRTVTVQED